MDGRLGRCGRRAGGECAARWAWAMCAAGVRAVSARRGDGAGRDGECAGRDGTVSVRDGTGR